MVRPVVVAIAAPAAIAAAPTSLPRVTSSSLVYGGAFRVPHQVSDQKTFSYGGTAIAYNPTDHALFAVGHDWYQLTAQVTIPRLVRSSKLRDLHRGHFKQPFSDAGDSGSLILERDSQQAAALLFAGSTTHTIANHIEDVLKALRVTLV